MEQEKMTEQEEFGIPAGAIVIPADSIDESGENGADEDEDDMVDRQEMVRVELQADTRLHQIIARKLDWLIDRGFIDLPAGIHLQMVGIAKTVRLRQQFNQSWRARADF